MPADPSDRAALLRLRTCESGEAVVTDMDSLEGALNEKWCHIALQNDDGSHEPAYACGLPLDELVHEDCDDVNGRCVICKRLACPDCERAYQERWA